MRELGPNMAFERPRRSPALAKFPSESGVDAQLSDDAPVIEAPVLNKAMVPIAQIEGDHPVMLVFAMMAVIQYRANDVTPPKRPRMRTIRI